ncbi:LCP family protein [Sciscionella marina]|uniref:LCP family protein n=1 Tax=Sciscionella marina TaxID=508770 RepID=UPI000378B43D|nr:LCP family protein [Sciscionella marina]
MNGGQRGIVDRYGNQGGGYRPPGYRPTPPRGRAAPEGARGRVTPEGYRPPARTERDPGGGRPRGGEDYGRRPPTARKRRRRWRPRRIIGLIVLLLVVLIVGFGVYIDTSLNRVDAITDYSGKPAAGEGTNWLIVGSDSREGLDEEQAAKLHTGTSQDAGGKRTDTMMLLHLPSNGTKPTLISLMRDSLVNIPGHGRTKLNAAFAYGGPQLLAKTVEQNTGMRLDHYMEIGFGGFAGIVDDVGGVNMCLKEPAKDDMAGINLKAGCQDLDGQHALGYVRSRHAFAASDYARTNHQREFIGALADQMASPATFLNPFRLFPLLADLPGSLTVDDTDHVWNLIGLAWDLRGISSGGVNTTIVPVSGSSGGSVVWSKSKAKQMFEALNSDQDVPQSLISTGAGGS